MDTQRMAGVLKDGDTLRMWYYGTPLSGTIDVGPYSVGLATSVDGINWNRRSSPVLAPGAAGEWDHDFFFPGNVLKEDSLYKMWYSGGTEASWSISYATSKDGIHWTKYDDPTTTSALFQFSDPVLQHGTSGQSDEFRAWSAWVLKKGTGYQMWYTGQSASQTVMYATSPDGIRWTKKTTPVLQGSGWVRDIITPCVIFKDNKYYMWFSGFLTSMTVVKIGYATAPATSLSWRPVAAGVNYAAADSIADEGVFIGMGGYTATPDLINSWLAALYDAKLRDLGIRHVYSVTGTDNLNNPRTNIPVLDLAKHLLGLMEKHPKGTRIILAGHSAGALTAQALLHDLYDGASIDSSHLTDGTITYFCLDGNLGQSNYGTQVTQAIVNRLAHLYAVYAYDPTTGIYSLNSSNMISLGGAFGASSSPLMLDVSGCGCQNNWCVHATLINCIPHTKTSGDPADFGAEAGHPIQTAYLQVIPTSVPNTPDLSLQPAEFRLYQNYPNSFNPSATIRYGLPDRTHVTLTVYNTLGQKVAELVNGEVETGYHSVEFNAGTLASGVYFYRLQAGSYVDTKKLLLVDICVRPEYLSFASVQST